MIVRNLTDLKMRITADWLLENFDFFNDYEDTCQHLRRKIELRQKPHTSRLVLRELGVAYERWLDKCRRRDSNPHP